MNLTDRPTGWGGDPVPQPGLADIQAASERIQGRAVRTPLVPLHSYSAKTDIFLKPEVLQPIGSFKLRGVLNWAESLPSNARKNGFSTTSAGNTAQALGYVARLLGVSARTLLPDSIPQNKLHAIVSYGVEPVKVPFNQLLDYMLEKHWQDEPYSYLDPWGNAKMIAGSGTIGLEIVDDLPEVDTVFAPVGGGGLISGVGSAIKTLRPSARVIGVQPETCPSLKKSFETGGGLWIEVGPTICDGTAVPVVVDEMYPLLRTVVDDVALVSEAAVKDAIRLLALRNKLVVEGSGALSVAAALAMPAEERGKSVCILSGGSIDADKLSAILTEPSGI